MTPKKASRYVVYTSIFFGLLMIFATRYFHSIGISQNYVYIILALWIIPFTYFSRKAKQ